MTLKRVILGILTAIAIALVGLSLLASWNQPQIQSRLELYQTNLLLHASEWQGENNQNANLSSARNNIVGADPLNTALTQYQAARDSTWKTLETTQAKFKEVHSAIDSKSDDNTLIIAQKKALSESIDQQSALQNELDLRLGILQASSGKTDAALQTWNNLVERSKTKSRLRRFGGNCSSFNGHLEQSGSTATGCRAAHSKVFGRLVSLSRSRSTLQAARTF